MITIEISRHLTEEEKEAITRIIEAEEEANTEGDLKLAFF